MRIKNKDTVVVSDKNSQDIALGCKKCGRRWWPMRLSSGRLPRNFSKCYGDYCPNGWNN